MKPGFRIGKYLLAKNIGNGNLLQARYTGNAYA